jgi:hypothetical protein
MDFYTFSLALGGAGLIAMALSGAGRHARIGSGARGHGHALGHHHPGGQTHGGHTVAKGSDGAPHGHAVADGASRALLALTSPKIAFSILLGLGTIGIVLRSTLTGIPLFAAALAGGVLFERLIVTPIWNSALRFASAPALTLESCVTDEAKAVTTFDADGHGVVAIELDGQMVQVLGTLQASDRAAGLRVRAGDRVRIEAVDAERNQCTVSAF